jgi:hypothetical protein
MIQAALIRRAQVDLAAAVTVAQVTEPIKAQTTTVPLVLQT